MDNRRGAAQLATVSAGGGGAAAAAGARPSSACALPASRRRCAGSADAEAHCRAAGLRLAAGLAGVRPARAAGFRAAGAVHAAMPLAGGALERGCRWTRLCRLGLVNSFRLAGQRAVLAVAHGSGAGFASARRADRAGPDARRRADGGAGLCRARRGYRGRPAVARGLAAGAGPDTADRATGSLAPRVLGLVWAYLVRFCGGGPAVGAEPAMRACR
jgi:hypothetical protein